MKTEGVKVEIREGAKLIAECSKCSLSMVDGKMINRCSISGVPKVLCVQRVNQSMKTKM